MQRFFVPPEILAADPVVLSGPLAHQLCHVLRLEAGAHIALLDDSGWEYAAELLHVTPQRTEAHIIARTRPDTEPRVRVTLYQALVSEQKLDWVLQKGTELGVSAFVPVVTARSLPARAGVSKLARWRRILTEAAEQSGRTRLPTVAAPQLLTGCLPPPPETLALMGVADGECTPLPEVLRGVPQRSASLALFIGPEGGFAPDEVERARAVGVRMVSFGPRTLRTETAGLAAVAALMCTLGEWE